MGLLTDLLGDGNATSVAAQTMAVYGDSIIEQGGEIPANPDTRPYSAWPWANVELNQAMSIVGNLGVGGQTTTQILARIGDVLALDPGWVFISAGTNNMGVVGGVAQAETDIAAMLDTFRSAGVRVALATIPPRTGGSYTGTIKADTLALNEWIRQQAQTRPGVVVVDQFAALSDTDSGNFAATLFGFSPTTDGVHLSATGGYVAGRALADALRPHVSTSAFPQSHPNPGANLLSKHRPGNGGATSGFTLGSTSAGTATWSDVARTDIPGSWKQVVVPAAGALTANTNATVDGSRLQVGDVVHAICEFDVSSMESGAAGGLQGIALSVRAWNGSTYTTFRYAFNIFDGPNVDRSGVLRTPDLTVPSGTTLLSWFLELRGGMTFRFDRIGLYAERTYPV